MDNPAKEAFMAGVAKGGKSWLNAAVSWYDDPSIPYASVTGHIRALRDGALVERPT